MLSTVLLQLHISIRDSLSLETLAVPKKGTIVPNMGTQTRTDEAGALFGKVRRSLLSLLFLNHENSYYFRELRDLVNAGSGAVHRELANLIKAGIITMTKQANQTRYQANRESPVFRELHDLFQKTTGIPHLLKKALEGLKDRIELAFIYGSFARYEQRPDSDIDLMVIGDVEFQELVLVLHKVQTEIGREVNPNLYTAASFAEKQDKGYIREVINSPKLYLIGGENELEEMVR